MVRKGRFIQKTSAFTLLAVPALIGAVLAAQRGPTPEAVPTTRVLVRVTANDGKILGSNVQGARITVRDASTDEILAEGLQEGSTGDTRLIMGARERGARVFDTEGAAGFLAELKLDRPTRVLVTGEGPLAMPHAMQTTSRSLLVVPGKDILGDGVILELLGFTVDMESPAAGVRVLAGEQFEVRGTVTMLCGCPTEPGGLWDASDYEIVARAVRGGSVVAEWPMEFSGAESTYETQVQVAQAGPVEIQMIAMDPGKVNFGMATRSLTVSRSR